MDPAIINSWIPIAITAVGAIFAALKAWDAYMRDKRLKDAQLAQQLQNAVTNAVGAVQQGSAAMIQPIDPRIKSTIPARLIPGVQHVLSNAEESLARWPMSPEKIAGKIVAEEGLHEIAANLAATGPEAAIPPMAPAGRLIGSVAGGLGRL